MTKPIIDAAEVSAAPVVEKLVVEKPTATKSAAAEKAPKFRSDATADRFMRWLLHISRPQKGAIMGAHKAFRYSLIISGIRCIITYLLVPILVPILSVAGWVATPISLLLCAYAAVNGVISVRRFWLADHTQRWMYTAFMGVVFLVLAFSLTTDITRVISAL